MRCLIPITQEMRNEKALKRAMTICDNIHLLYVLDRSLLDRMERESAYILDSETLKEIERTVIKAQKDEAMELLKRVKRSGTQVHLHFEVGDYLSILENYALKLRPRLLMTDVFARSLLSLRIPLWIDAGNEINRCVFVVESAVRINKTEKNINMVKDICKIIKCKFFIATEKEDREIRNLLKRYGPLTDSIEGDLLALECYRKKMMSGSKNSILIF